MDCTNWPGLVAAIEADPDLPEEHKDRLIKLLSEQPLLLRGISEARALRVLKVTFLEKSTGHAASSSSQRTRDSGQAASSFSQRTRNSGLEELWKQLAEAEETNGFLELPALISTIFPEARAGKLLVRDTYRKLLRIVEERSGAKLVSDEQYLSDLPQSSSAADTTEGPQQADVLLPSKRQKTESDQPSSKYELQDTKMAPLNVVEGFYMFEPDSSSPVPELAPGYVDRAMGITGTPGIGKTMFLAYLLHFLASNGKTVVLETTDRVQKYLFSSDGCYTAASLVAFWEELADEDTFYLVDSKVPNIKNAMTVMVSSPRKSIVETFRKSARIYYMPVWTVPELNVLRNAVYRNSRSVQDVNDLYMQWGGCVRWVMEKSREESEKSLEDSVDASTADNLLAACTSYNDDEVSNRIVHHVPTDDLELLNEVVFASRHVASLVYKKLVNTQKIVWFLERSAGVRRCSTMRGYLFVEHVINTQSQGDLKYTCNSIQ